MSIIPSHHRYRQHQMTIVLNFNPKWKFKPLNHGSRIDPIIYYQRPWESMMRTALKIKLFIYFVRHRCTFDFKLLFGFWRFSLSLPNYWQLPVEIEIRRKKKQIFTKYQIWFYFYFDSSSVGAVLWRVYVEIVLTPKSIRMFTVALD